MALTNKLTAIANAIRSKTGQTGKLTLDGMAAAISSLKTTFSTQAKTATPTKATQSISPDANYDGLSKVTVNPIPAEYIIPSGSEVKTANGTYDVKALAEIVVNVAGGGGGLPAGIAAIDMGEITVASAFTTSRQTFNHNLGTTPDFVFVYAPANIATTYSMMFAFRHTGMGYRSSAYNSYYGYHGNSTTTVTMANSNSASYGVSNMTATTFQLASHSTSYYWRAGKYKYIAIKFA